MGVAEGRLYLLRTLPTGKNKTQITLTLRKRNHRLSDADGGDQRLDTGNRPG